MAKIQPPEYNPRNPEGIEPEVPFVEELGEVQKGKSPKSYKQQGWIPFSARDKRPVKEAIFDNMEVPGSAFPGRDRSESPGEMAGGMGNPQSRNTENQARWERVERDGTSEFPADDVDSGSEQRLGFEGLNYKDYVLTLEEQNEFLPASKDNSKILNGSTKEKPMELKKVIAESKSRLERVYSIEEDYSAYGRYCGENTCVGVWKELLGFEQKRAMKIVRDSEVWKCPKCGKVTSAVGSISEQTSGPAAYNTYNSGMPATDEDFSPVNSIKPDTKRQLR